MVIGVNLVMQVAVFLAVGAGQGIYLMVLPLFNAPPNTNNECQDRTSGPKQPAQDMNSWLVHYLLNDLTTCAAK